MNFFQLTLTAGIATMAFALSSCDDAQSDVSATFDANVATVALAFADFQAEDEHFFTHFSEDAYWAGTSLNAPDSIALADVAPMYRELWGKYDYTLIAEPNFLPGVNPESKETDGSVRGYFKWNITKPATDSTEQKSVDVKIYESFDFDANGKVDWTQVYANMQAAYASLED
tara:strand:- start:2868 stop:3383 length:516 start_codon:yes stop_codon:yes gene_type:complete